MRNVWVIYDLDFVYIYIRWWVSLFMIYNMLLGKIPNWSWMFLSFRIIFNRIIHYLTKEYDIADNIGVFLDKSYIYIHVYVSDTFVNILYAVPGDLCNVYLMIKCASWSLSLILEISFLVCGFFLIQYIRLITRD